MDEDILLPHKLKGKTTNELVNMASTTNYKGFGKPSLN
jgi:hypothetical protein